MAMSVGIVSVCQHSGVGQVGRQQVTKPQDSILRRPRLLAMTIQSMDCDNAGKVCSAATTFCAWATYSTVGSVPETISRNPRLSILDFGFVAAGVLLVDATGCAT